MSTVYEHNGKQIFTDEADAYEIEDIRVHYAQFDKSLVTATYTVIPPEKEGEPRKVIFAKKTGTKGLNPVVAVILETPPAQIEALVILNEFLGGPELPDPEKLLRECGRIETALEELERVSDASGKVIKLCLESKAIAATAPPAGF
jgi:hypothetical protein